MAESSAIATRPTYQEPTMTTPRLLAASQQFTSLALAALITSAVLLSLGVQANEHHAEALARTAPAAQLCAVPPAAARS